MNIKKKISLFIFWYIHWMLFLLATLYESLSAKNYADYFSYNHFPKFYKTWVNISYEIWEHRTGQVISSSRFTLMYSNMVVPIWHTFVCSVDINTNNPKNLTYIKNAWLLLDLFSLILTIYRIFLQENYSIFIEKSTEVPIWNHIFQNGIFLGKDLAGIQIHLRSCHQLFT